MSTTFSDYRQSLKLRGLKFYEKDNGDWAVLILDPRLTGNVVNSVIRMVMTKLPYPTIRKNIGKWFTRKHLETIETMIFVSTDDRMYELRMELERTIALKREMEKMISV